MVRAKITEYQHAYQGADPNVVAEFVGKCDYAAKRRLVESLHFQCPFEWDDPDVTDIDRAVEQVTAKFKQQVELVPEKCCPSSTKPVIRKKVGIDKCKYSTKGVQVEQSLLEKPKSASPSHNSTFDRSWSSKNRCRSATPSGSASSYFRSYRPFVNVLPPVRRGELAVKCQHIHDKNVPAEYEMLDGVVRPSEFSPYAVGNKSRRISGKRTHNVRADRGVYSTALRASAIHTASNAYSPPSSAAFRSPSPTLVKRGYPCPYDQCRCSKNY